MAKTKEVSVTLGRTVNLGDFNSGRIEMSEVLTLEGSDNPRKVRAEALSRLKKEVGAVVEELDTPAPRTRKGKSRD